MNTPTICVVNPDADLALGSTPRCPSHTHWWSQYSPTDYFLWLAHHPTVTISSLIALAVIAALVDYRTGRRTVRTG